MGDKRVMFKYFDSYTSNVVANVLMETVADIVIPYTKSGTPISFYGAAYDDIVLLDRGLELGNELNHIYTDPEGLKCTLLSLALIRKSGTVARYLIDKGCNLASMPKEVGDMVRGDMVVNKKFYAKLIKGGLDV